MGKLPKEIVMSAEVTAAKPLTPKEQELLRQLTKPGATVSMVVPAEIDEKEWYSTASVVCRAVRRAQAMEQSSMAVLGKLLQIAQDTPTIYTNGQFENFETFLKGHVEKEWGIGRSTAYEAMNIAKRWGHLSINQVATIPRDSWKILNKAVPKGDETKKMATGLIEKAAAVQPKELRLHCEKRGLVNPGETVGAFIHFPTNQEIAGLWREFTEDARIQAYCESGDKGIILMRMIQYCSGEFMQAAAPAEPVAEAVTA